MLRDLRLNRRGIRELLRSDGMADLVGGIADDVASRAADAAPVGRTGRYRSSIRSTVAMTDRRVGRVIADAPHAVAVEARHGTLNRALTGGR